MEKSTSLVLVGLVATALATAQEREVGGVLAATETQTASPMTTFQLSLDGSWTLAYTEKHLLSIRPTAALFEIGQSDRDAALGMHRLQLRDVVLSHDGTHFACRRADGTVEVRERDRGDIVTTHRNLPAGLLALHGAAVSVAGEDGKVYIPGT
ncbi:MAG: hypothetical protein KAI24_16525, partial [Planctomycetes bacterium]|nr:hypothetical protein [Planctomycetota bacterium]